MSRMPSPVFWIGLSSLVLLGAGGGQKRYRVPPAAVRLLPAFRLWSDKTGIPLDVLLAWAWLESSFHTEEYNPEKSAMASWSCEVASKPAIWGRNPHYEEAVEVCRRLSQGQSTDQVLNAGLWAPGAGFGSYGILQVARIVAHEVGTVPGSVNNSRLFDLTTNMNAGTREILDRRKKLYPGRKTLTDDEWSWVRAAYVGGPGILTKNPDKAREIATKFLVKLRTEVRAAVA